LQWYGESLAVFRTVGSSVATVWSLVHGGTQYSEAAGMSTASLSSFTMIVFTTSLRAVIALVIHAALLATLYRTYSSVRRTAFHYSPTDTRDYEMTGLLVKRLQRWLGVIKPKPVDNCCCSRRF